MYLTAPCVKNTIKQSLSVSLQRNNNAGGPDTVRNAVTLECLIFYVSLDVSHWTVLFKVCGGLSICLFVVFKVCGGL